jgi:hypothetical protein
MFDPFADPDADTHVFATLKLSLLESAMYEKSSPADHRFAVSIAP